MIDDLIKFCLAEIAYEGELGPGCSVDRLKELVTLFYEQHPISSNTAAEKKKQNIDSKYLAYIYSLLTSHPSIIIGTVPADSPPVWIAPPPHKKGTTPTKPPVTLNAIDANGQSLGELEEKYGAGLRIAADRATCFVSLTGSHTRPTKLSDMVYTTLQIIARTREKGIAIKDLGPITGYDPKSIFYQIQQLVSLNLVVKLSRVPSINWAVHRRFYERSELWQKIQSGANEHLSAHAGAEISRIPTDEAGQDAEGDAIEETTSGKNNEAELLANVPLLRMRVLRLLEGSVNQTHQYTNLILAAGYTSPTKQQRRFFTSRVSQMIDDGLLDKIAIQTPRGNAACLQLTQKGREYLANISTADESTIGDIGEVVVRKDQEDILTADMDEEEFIWTDDNRLLRSIGLQRQIIQNLESRPDGVTITELSSALGFFDRRTIEQVLTRLCTRIPPRHLANLHPVTVMETAGKIRRQRYFTLEHYQTLLRNQNLPDARYDWIHMNEVGGYSFVDNNMVWKTKGDLTSFIESFQHERRGIRGGRVPSAKKKIWKNPVINGVVKKGRPRKEWAQKKPISKAKGKKAAELEDEGQSDMEAMDVVAPPPTGDKGKKTQATTSTGQSNAAQEETSITAEKADALGNQNAYIQDIVWVNEQGPSPSTPRTRQRGPAQSPIRKAVTTTSQGSKAKKRPASAMEEEQPSKPKKRRKVGDNTPAQNSASDPLATSMDVITPDPPDSVPADASAVAIEVDESSGGLNVVNSASQQPPLSPSISRLSPSDKRRPPKQPKPRPTNVSALRRHQEILDLIQNNGGIMQQNLEMAILLRDHVQNLVNQGVQTGQDAGFLPDKRTIVKAVDTLEEMGLLKVLKTAIVDGNRKNSLQQPTTLLYLPEKTQEDINSFIESLHKPYKQTQGLTPLRAVNDVVEYSKVTNKTLRKTKEKEKVPEVHAVDVLSMMGPRKKFLEDRQTIAQLFGFLLGRLRRAQELHLYTLSHVLSDSPASTVISAEQKIVSTKFWTEDYPLGSFCAIIPAQSYIPYLESAQLDPVALNQPLKSLDVRLQRALKVQHARTRHRLLDLLRLLCSLQLVIPLEESDTGSIVINDPGDGGEQRAFEPTELPHGKSADMPDYWQLSDQAPVWLFSLAKFTSQKIEEAPPFYADMSLLTVEDATSYWSLLRKLCDRQSSLTFAEGQNNGTSTRLFTVPAAELASLCNHRSWTSSYRLSKIQEDYLKGLIDVSTLTTPLDDPARLMQAAFLTCAPQQIVYDYFSSQKDKLSGAAERIQRRQLRVDGSSQQAVKRAVAAKAEKHLQNIGSQWDAIVAELVERDLIPEEEEQLRPLRSRYIIVGGQVDKDKIKDLILNIIRNPVLSAKRRHKKLTGKTLLPRSVEVEHIEQAIPEVEAVFKSRFGPIRQPIHQSVAEDGFPPLPPPVNLQSKTVAELISEMDYSHRAPALSKKKKGDTPHTPTPRKSRFKWSEEYGDLLCDTVAVLKARCRGKARSIQWLPAEIAFPPVRANNLRTRFGKSLNKPGARNYMDRLEQAWYNLWQAHKGRPELPDDDPSKVDGCDLKIHIDFLRKYVDKRDLFSDTVFVTTSGEDYIDLPASIEGLESEYEIELVDSSTFESMMQAYWGEGHSYINERSHALITGAFTELKVQKPSTLPLKLAVAQSAIQMIVATEQEQYVEEQATTLLRPFGDDLVKEATSLLVKRGAINNFSKTKAGRTYTMSESNAEELSGMLPLQRCEDAAALERVYEEEPEDWRTWPLVTTDGEMAALLRRASDHAVDFKIQLPDLKNARDSAQWSSRKIQDEMLESQVAVLFDQPVPLSPSYTQSSELLEPDEPVSSKPTKRASINTKYHGLNIHGKKAACALQSGTGVLVDCSKCLDTAQADLLKRFTRKESGLIKPFLSRLIDAGEEGIAAEEVWSSQDAEFVVREITMNAIALAFWSGYNQSQLISTRFLGSYAVLLSKQLNDSEEKPESRLVMPRRWTNLQGDAATSTWKAALRAVVGLLLIRPLLDHHRLIQSFEKAYDRLDILAVLRFLEDHDIITRIQDIDYPTHSVGEMTVEEEHHTFWEVKGAFDWSDLV